MSPLAAPTATAKRSWRSPSPTSAPLFRFDAPRTSDRGGSAQPTLHLVTNVHELPLTAPVPIYRPRHPLQRHP